MLDKGQAARTVSLTGETARQTKYAFAMQGERAYMLSAGSLSEWMFEFLKKCKIVLGVSNCPFKRSSMQSFLAADAFASNADEICLASCFLGV